MKVVVLGVGLQGRAVIHDLDRSPLVDEIIAGDLDGAAAQRALDRLGAGKTRALAVDASNEADVARALRETGADVVVCMVPPDLGYTVARGAIAAGVPFVSASYRGRIAELDAEARARGVTVLPEMGLDPGIDLILGGMAVREFDEVHGLHSYGAGLPEPACADNALKYKVTWTFDGVLKAYKRPARLLRGGMEVSVPGKEIFRPENTHVVEIPGLGPLEAYANGDAVHFAEVFGIGKGLRDMGRFALRYPGHCAFWSIMADMGFLDDEPLKIGGASVTPHQFLVRHLAPRLGFREGERDMVILRVHAWGLKGGDERDIVYEIIDYRDLETGFFSMNRTVGFTASIAAQLVLAGKVRKPGVLSPAHDVPAQTVVEELALRGIRVERRETAYRG